MCVWGCGGVKGGGGCVGVGASIVGGWVGGCG